MWCNRSPRVVRVEPGVLEENAGAVPLGCSVQLTCVAVLSGSSASAQLMRSRFGGVNSSTWQAIRPENPVCATGRPRKVNWDWRARRTRRPTTHS